ncbi:hypothetical protein E4T56_gene19867 [Termitomyces sp. T112]|nr:hypothetical protein E4T56_gene19867 [Termitomyces sp. T112]
MSRPSLITSTHVFSPRPFADLRENLRFSRARALPRTTDDEDEQENDAHILPNPFPLYLAYKRILRLRP